MFQFTVPELQADSPAEEFHDEPVFDALNEGVTPGGLNSKRDIKMLLLFLLDQVGGEVSKTMMGEVMQEQSIANYFEVMDAISELVEIGNLHCREEKGEEMLSITERGRGAVEMVTEDIPKTIREVALKSLVHFQTLERNAKENEVVITKRDGGYDVSFSLKDHDFSMMELTIYAADRSQAEKLKKNFLEDPARIYSSLLAALMVD